MSILGAFLLTFLAILRIASMTHSGFSALGFLLFFQAGLGALLMVFRRKAKDVAPRWVEGIAWLSAALPLSFHAPASMPYWKMLLPLPGLLLNLWALACLGTVFGIAPARRALVTGGPYRRLRHPMYAGELLSLAGGLLASFSLWNLILILAFAASLAWRIAWEERLMNANGYAAYAQSVRWRLVPGIW